MPDFLKPISLVILQVINWGMLVEVVPYEYAYGNL